MQSKCLWNQNIESIHLEVILLDRLSLYKIVILFESLKEKVLHFVKEGEFKILEGLVEWGLDLFVAREENLIYLVLCENRILICNFLIKIFTV